MNARGNKKPSKEWRDMSKKEKHDVLAVLITVSLFALFWISNGFLSSLGMLLFLWSAYFLGRTIFSKSKRKKSIITAGALFIMYVLIMPTPTESDTQLSNAQAIDESQQQQIDAEKTAETKEAERLAEEKKLADNKDREQKEKSAQQATLSGDLYRVTSITDGDTIKVNINGSVETIRFIGMDTPETKDPRKPVQCFGREASSRMQHYAQSKKVRLESDASQGDRDRYGRLLRYVYAEDGKNIAYEMIRGGYAHEYTYNLPYKYQAQFKNAQRYARENDKGLWAPTTCNGETNQQHARKPQPKPKPAPKPVVPPSSVYYKNCTAARAAGAAPVYRGQPGYGSHLDRDNDGIGCE